MDESAGFDRTRRLAGWLLAIGTPGIAAGLMETALAAIRTTAGFVSVYPTTIVTFFVFWGLSAIGSAVGGWLIASGNPRRFNRFLAALLSLAAGSAAYLFGLYTFVLIGKH